MPIAELLTGGEDAWSITGVYWEGGYWNNLPVPFDYRVIFYADRGDGNAPTGGPTDPTGTALVVYDFPYAETNERFNGVGYAYNVELQPPFVAEAHTKYWLAVQSVRPFPPKWGWVGSGRMQLHEVVMGFPMLGSHYWTDGTIPFGSPRDAAFRLLGVPRSGDLCGDANCDTAFNGADIDAFFLALSDPA
ncbi:MAG: hypothetical protein GY953_31845, partial [bacterium]|nr:hypothetical protein [bacterium]